ncbi:MAG: HAD-IG family 5'-nucleotidase [Methanomicrobiales archaeon]|nr:HAD-IG family 5'-nucleotidase [Methanomicrobiales archaeon]
MANEPAGIPPEQEKKIHALEQDLNDLRQGLTVVADYYKDLEKATLQQEAAEAVDNEINRQLVDDEQEFEGIWRFHEEMLVAEPGAHITFDHMYEAFLGFCTRTGREPVEREAFEFVFSRMENPSPEMDRGEWIGFRLRERGT